MSTARIIRIIVGVPLAVFGVAGVAFGLLAMIDPVGAKASDDGDPFGPPPTFLFSLVVALVHLALMGAGIFLIAYKGKRSISN